MSTSIKTNIIKIGNSHGIRIPKIFLEQSSLSHEVELILENDQIVIRSIHPPRFGWEDAFRAMAHNNDDQLIDGDSTGQSSWDEEEWGW